MSVNVTRFQYLGIKHTESTIFAPIFAPTLRLTHVLFVFEKKKAGKNRLHRPLKMIFF
jgi:hypothetical protein